jgi:hypothetical protein
MLKHLPFFAGVVCILFATSSLAQNSDKDLQKLAADAEQELNAKKQAKDPAPASQPDTGRMALSQFRGAIARGNSAEIEMALMGLSAYLDSDQLRMQCDELAAKFHAEREAQEKKTVEEINTALKQAGDAVRAAKKPADLDAVLHDLGQLRERRNGQQSSAVIESALNKVEPTLQFVMDWQDYLADTSAGKNQAAREALQKLSNGYRNQPDLIPRSEILARLEFIIKPPIRQNDEETPNGETQSDNLTVEKPLRLEKSTRDIVFNIKKLDELDAVVKALENLKPKREFKNYMDSINTLLETLTPLNRAYKELKSGLATKIELPSSKLDKTAIQNEIVPLRAELITLALPRYLGLPQQSKAKPGEGPYDFLNRISAEAGAHNDYLLVARAHETQRLLREGTNPNPNEKSQAELFVAAHNQEVAGQYALAVDSYEKALACGTEIVPPKIIGERLAAIKAAHPQEFQQGFDLYLSPPATRYPPGYYPPGLRPGMPQRPEPVPRAALSVPAVSPAPSPSKSPEKK